MAHKPLAIDGPVRFTLEYQNLTGDGFVNYQLTVSSRRVFYLPSQGLLKSWAREAGLVGYQEQSRHDIVGPTLEITKVIFFQIASSSRRRRNHFLRLISGGNWAKKINQTLS